MSVIEAVSAVLVALVGLAGVVLTSVVIPYIRTKVSAEQLQKVREIARLAVAATEQIAPGLEVQGREKYYEALRRAGELAASVGIDVNDPVWDTLIEQAVHEMNNVISILDEITLSATVDDAAGEDVVSEERFR